MAQIPKHLTPFDVLGKRCSAAGIIWGGGSFDSVTESTDYDPG